MTANCKVSICIVNWNTYELTKECIESVLQAGTRVSIEVILVDNGSEDGSPDLLERDFPGIRLIRNRDNMGFVTANNQAIREASGEYIMFLNSDTILHQAEMIEGLTSFMDDHRGEVGGVSPRMFLDRECILELPSHPCFSPFLFASSASRFGRRFPQVKNFWTRNRKLWKGDYLALEVPALIGACMMVPRNLLEEIGGFDKRLFMFFEDMVLSHRIRQKGLKLVILSDFSLIHLYNKSGEMNPKVEKYFIDGMKIVFPEMYGFPSFLCGILCYKTLSLSEKFAKKFDVRKEIQVKSKEDHFLEWNELPETKKYLVEFSMDPTFLGVVGAVSEEPRFSLRAVMDPDTDGRIYYWRWTTLEPEGRQYKYDKFVVRLDGKES